MAWSFWNRILAVIAIVPVLCSAAVAADSIEPLKIQGEDFLNPAGQPVRFWGVNLVGFYPDHAKADAIAADLASREINLVRPHHTLRPSSDWNPKMISGALLTYKETSRQFDPDALDKFDYLNAALRKNGIYLAFSTHWTRKYLPGDVDILKTTDADRDAWMAALKEMNGWGWQKSFDLFKLLPVVDERAAQLNEEFAKNLLGHVNPYSGKTYASDPQVLTFEVLNESSAEYAIVCGNKFPDYWNRKLDEKWQAFAKAAGVVGGDLYKPASPQIAIVRAKFLRKLDEDYFERMKAVLHAAGSTAPVTFSNLWRGENNLQMHAEHADFIEAHMYGDPLVTREATDFIAAVSKTALVGKPFFVNELNQAESSSAIQRQAPVRTMLPLAAAAYGSFNNWAGLCFFAWTHGDTEVGPDGWARVETRDPNLGRMVVDGMMIDHLRTSGILFKRGLIAKSTSPVALHVDEPLEAGNYNDLMRGKYTPRPGWQDIHAIRKTFGPAPAEQATAEWLTKNPPSLLTSDTGQIVKDITRQQLVIAAPQAEAFSGTLDAAAPAALQHLAVAGQGFATVIVVADDGKPLAESASLVISRTALDPANHETGQTTVTLRGLRSEADGRHWYVHLTRPRDSAALLKDFTRNESLPLKVDQGTIALPPGDWHECELHWQP